MHIRDTNPHLPFGDQRTAPWYGQDILSVNQFDRKDLEYIFAVAHEMRVMVERVGTFDLLKGKILANLFYEPSTRTSSSFTSAMERLGGSVIPINEVKYSSVTKGESLVDTVRTLECYADVIVLRHPETGSAAAAAKAARKPIINAGDGTGEHPTQALLDTFTIREELGRLDRLNVTMLGDLKYGRTVHSLARLLSKYRRHPPRLRLARNPTHAQRGHGRGGCPQGAADRTHQPWPGRCRPATCSYVTRVQKERFEDPAAYEQVKNAYVIDPAVMKSAKQDMIVMHPLPRVTEISMDFDEDPRAAYFRQMEYGLYVRMALLAIVLGKA